VDKTKSLKLLGEKLEKELINSLDNLFGAETPLESLKLNKDQLF
jgi:hypothetical protein